jgi:aerobic-type carbon monoxide dehydrogenase small subunit (CoxS/CutS family)
MPFVEELHVNGKAHRLRAEEERSLLSVLRDDLELTGAKYGCGEAQCGACTVLLDGQPVRACVTQVGSVGRRKVTTIEGLEENGRLHPVQEAFVEADALQCGYCTPGMIMSGVALLRKNGRPSEQEIVKAMNGNLCRCCAYPRILEALKLAAKKSAEAKR